MYIFVITGWSLKMRLKMVSYERDGLLFEKRYSPERFFIRGSYTGVEKWSFTKIWRSHTKEVVL